MATKALITSRDPKGVHAVGLFEAAYNRSKLDDGRAQRLNERGDELQAGIRELIAKLSVSAQFTNEEAASNWGYPPEYKVRPIGEQIGALTNIFSLSLADTMAFVENELPKITLPDGAEGWFAIPRFDKVASSYGAAVERVLAEVAKSRKFQNYREGQLGPDRLRQHERTVAMWERITEMQSGDIVVVPAQLGLRHRGRSIRRAREVFTASEFGLGAFAVMSILFTHPEREVRWEQLHVDCAGDEYSPDADGQFEDSPYVNFGDGRLEFGANWFGDADEGCGSASGFLSQ